MPYVIDGHNLIGRTPGLSLGDLDDELALVRRLEAFCRQVQRNADVFFDGAPPGHSGVRKFGRVRAHFVRCGKTADEAIGQFLQKLGGAASNWTLVTSDHTVRKAGQAAHAKVMDAGAFLHLMEQAGSTAPGGEKPGIADVDEWLAVFGDKD